MRGNFKIFLCTIIFVWIILPATSLSVSRNDAELYEEAIKCRKKLYASASFALKEANWLQCINRYKLVYIQNANTRLIDNILLDVSNLYLELYAKTRNKKYLQSALSSLRELYYYYPESRFAALATLKAGDIYFKKLKQYSRAHGAYDRVLKYYGKTKQARKARNRLKELASHYAPVKTKRISNSRLVTVRDVRHWTNPRYTRVVIDLDANAVYEKHVLKNPDRLFIDFHGARVSDKLNGRALTINDGLLKLVRAGQHDNKTVRVVLDLDRIDRYKIFELKNPFRVVVDVSGNGKKSGRPALSDEGKSDRQNGKEKLSLARQLALGIETIVIDPGHGGKDPGAIGRTGLMEKDVVLDISKKLKKIIEENTGRRVYLTRYNDVFLPLEERTAIANTREADLFVSIHINANKKRNVRGMETYYLSLATTQEEQQTAARENQASYKKISDLEEILSSIMLNSKIDESRVLAHNIQSSLVKGLKGKNRTRNLGVRKAPFYVLIGAQMPSVLIEASFITNSREEKLLSSPKYRQEVARQIYHGLEAYINQMKAQKSVASN